jgi:hypothetical protein
MHPPNHPSSPTPIPLPQLPLPGFGLAASPTLNEPLIDQPIAPRVVWAQLSTSQRARIRQTARRICQELLHDADRCA